jgi:3-isopropylmalate dehydrogenase
MGLMPSASGEHTSLYEPIHGSYPQATGLNIAISDVLSAAMMFEDALIKRRSKGY